MAKRKKTGAVRTEKRMTEERNAKIEAGKYFVTELETLKLQKLMHQGLRLKEAADRAQAEANKIGTRFNDELAEVKESHGLEGRHAIDLRDEKPGLVYIDKDYRPEPENPVVADELKEKAAEAIAKDQANEEPVPAQESSEG